jgi:lysophospholipase L1-like esterase
MWTNAVFGLRITGFSLDYGAATVANGLSNATDVSKLRSLRGIIYGDSIEQGTGAGTGSASQFAKVASVIAAGLNMEYGSVAVGSTGYTVGAFGVPAFTSSYNLVDGISGHTRNFAGLDYIIVLHGTNDTSSLTATTVQTMIGNLRTAAGPATKIVICVPAGNDQSNFIGMQTAITNGVANYKAANPSDARVFLIDVTSISHNWFPGSGTSGYLANGDALHPNQIGHALYGGLLVQAILNATQYQGGVRRIH